MLACICEVKGRYVSMRAFYKKHMNVIINIALLAATLAIVFIAIKLIIPYFLPFLLGLILAVVMEPVVKIFLKLKMPRASATGMAMLVTVGSLATITWFAVAKIVVELSLFIADIPFYTGVLKNLSVTHEYRKARRNIVRKAVAFCQRYD